MFFCILEINWVMPSSTLELLSNQVNMWGKVVVKRTHDRSFLRIYGGWFGKKGTQDTLKTLAMPS